MTTSERKPLLTKADLPLDKIAEICKRWNIHEMAVDTNQIRPPAHNGPNLDSDPFAEVDLYLIVKFDSDKYEWRFNEHHFKVVAELEELTAGKSLDNGQHHSREAHRRGRAVGSPGQGKPRCYLLPMMNVVRQKNHHWGVWSIGATSSSVSLDAMAMGICLAT